MVLCVLDEGDPLANALLKKYRDVRMPNLHFYAATTAPLIADMEKAVRCYSVGAFM